MQEHNHQNSLPYCKQNITLSYLLDSARNGKVHLFESMAKDWPFVTTTPTPESWYLIVPTILYLCREPKMHEWLKNNIDLFKQHHQANFSISFTLKSILDSVGKLEKRDLKACIITLNEYQDLSEYVFDTNFYFCEEFHYWEELKQPLKLSQNAQKKILSDLFTDGPTTPPCQIDLILVSNSEKQFSKPIKSFYKHFLKICISIGIHSDQAIKHFKHTLFLRLFHSSCMDGFNWYINKYPNDTNSTLLTIDQLKFNKSNKKMSLSFFDYWKKYLCKMIPVECMIMKLLSTECPFGVFEKLVPNSINDQIKRIIYGGDWMSNCERNHTKELLWYLFKECEFLKDHISINLGEECNTLMNLFVDVEMKRDILFAMLKIKMMIEPSVFNYNTKSQYLIHLMAIGQIKHSFGESLLPHLSQMAVCRFQPHGGAIKTELLDKVWNHLDIKNIDFWYSLNIEQNHKTWSLLKNRGIEFDMNERAWENCQTKEDLIWLFMNHFPHTKLSSANTIVRKMDQLDAFEEGLRFLQISKIERSEMEIELILNNSHQYLSKFNIERLESSLRPRKRPISQN